MRAKQRLDLLRFFSLKLVLAHFPGERRVKLNIDQPANDRGTQRSKVPFGLIAQGLWTVVRGKNTGVNVYGQ